MLVAIAAAVALRIVFANASFGNVAVNADESMSFLLAKFISEGNRPLLFWTQPYQFPFESYLMALFFDVLPWNGFGLRIVQVTLCVVSAVGFCITYRFLAPLKTAWPGLLLILFPSAYWLTRQVGLMTPQHAMMVTCAWLLPLIVIIAQRSQRRYLWISLGGFLAGVALSNHLLSLSLVFMASLSLCLASDFRSARASTLSFLPGFLVGFSPFLYAKLTIPGAYGHVAESGSIIEGYKNIWDPILVNHLPTAFGVDPWIFPDAAQKITQFSFLVEPIAYLFVFVLLATTLVRARLFFQRWKLNRWPSVEINDVFVGTTLLALYFLIVSMMSLRARYLLHIVWCFPFLLSYLYAVAPKYGRALLGSIVFLLVGLNLINSTALIKRWSGPTFSSKYANLQDLKPLYQYFEKHKVTHCYAPWWISYRLIVESKEKFICSPPFNDRFPGWPQPYYRKIVDLSPNTPYVIGRYAHRLFRSGKFVPYLRHHRIIADHSRVGAFNVYRNFSHRDATSSAVIDATKLSSSASHQSDQSNFLIDGELETVWSSASAQQEGMWLEIEFPEKRSIHGVRLFSRGQNYEKDLPFVRIETRADDGSWKTALSNSAGQPHLVKLDDSFKRYHYGALELIFGFEPVSTSAIRVVIEKPNSKLSWDVAELQVFAEASP